MDIDEADDQDDNGVGVWNLKQKSVCGKYQDKIEEAAKKYRPKEIKEKRYQEMMEGNGVQKLVTVRVFEPSLALNYNDDFSDTVWE